MKVLFLCFDLGNSPTGKTNLKILQSLLKFEDIEVKIICNDKASVTLQNTFKCKTFPDRPSRLFESLGNLIRTDISNYFWEARAKRLAKLITKDWQPNIIYARANPPSVFKVGYFIAQMISKPLFLHSGDPIPPTPDWNNNRAYRQKKLKAVIPAIKYCTQISFINEEMINYEQSLLDFNIIQKSFISPNPITNKFIEVGNNSSSTRRILLYLGSFFGSRSPEELIHGFKILILNNKNVELHFYGTEPSTVLPYLSDDLLRDTVKIFEKTSDIISVISKADVLIDVDADYTPQVFTSSKLMDYLSIQTPILCITPMGSATRSLLKKVDKSIIITNNDRDSIYKSLVKILEKEKESFNYEDRRSLLTELAVENVTNRIVDEFKKVIHE